MPPTRLCKSCQAPIIWATTAAKEQPIPLDAKPEKRVVLEEIPLTRGFFWRASVVDTYMPHHVTCPDAKQWRRKRQESKR